MLILYKKVFLGITSENLKAKVNDLSIFELIVYVKLTLLIFLIGIKPDIILDYTTSSLDRITKLYPISIF
jgi:NADH:ubiquinone oxidoreductase subunit 4 (subunit M)